MRYKVTVAYDGSFYGGWQKQKNNSSIQERIEYFLSKICNEPIEIFASGRTDKGVHAIGQVFHFDTTKKIDSSKLQYALNNFLENTIRIVDVEPISENFHARFHATSKIYRYIFSYDQNNPFIQSKKTILKQVVDIEKMRKVSEIFIGTHDFTSFTSAKIDERKSRIKKIYRIDINQIDQDICIEIHGNGFLRYMVRMIVQTILEVGKNKLSYQEVKKMLEKKDKQCCRFKAQPEGLYLVKVFYEGEQ